jgi:hypothetical protein
MFDTLKHDVINLSFFNKLRCLSITATTIVSIDENLENAK